jgi:hypothetical protein
MPDAELATALKQAKSKTMFFAFVPKGADGKLIVSKTKVPPKLIAEAKKAIGGGNAVTGKCFGGDGGAMVFQVAKAAPPALAAAVKKVAKRDTGLSIDPDFQLAGDADAEEQDTGAVAGVGAPVAAPTAPMPAPAQANVLGIQKALQKLGFDPGKIDGVIGPHTQAAIKNFQQANGLAADGILGPKTQAALAMALKGGQIQIAPIEKTNTEGGKSAVDDWGPWSAARQNAIADLKALAAKVAGTKHGAAVGVLEEINSIITMLPAKPAPHELDKLNDFIRNDDTITAAEEVPAHFHALDIRGPLLKALAAMRK